MKTCLLAVAFAALVTQYTLAQGRIAPSLFQAGGIVFETFLVHAPVTNAVTGELLASGAYLGQLYYGPDQYNIDHTFPNGGGGFMQGYIRDGNCYVDPAVVVPGAVTWFELRAWEAGLGTTWEFALANWSTSTFLGKSDPFATRTSNGGGPPRLLTGLQPFGVWPIPEPSVLALGILGLGALLWRRRR